jgi:membrane protein YdbS with pleckstrin-like domain
VTKFIADNISSFFVALLFQVGVSTYVAYSTYEARHGKNVLDADEAIEIVSVSVFVALALLFLVVRFNVKPPTPLQKAVLGVILLVACALLLVSGHRSAGQIYSVPFLVTLAVAVVYGCATWFFVGGRYM